MPDLQGYGYSVLQGALLTAQVALLSLVIASLLGMLGALAKLSRWWGLRFSASVYTTVIRGVPDLVLMLLIFYGGQTLLNDVGTRMDWDYIDVNPFIAGVLTIGFIFGAYMTETFRGAILSVPEGQLEAGFAYGMSRTMVFFHILLPQMIRHALPGFGNNWLVLLKATALVSVIGLNDMVRLADLAGKATRLPFTFYLLVALGFLAFTTVSILLLKWVERRYNPDFQRR